MLKADEATLSFEERKLAAPCLEFFVEKALSTQTFRKGDGLLIKDNNKKSKFLPSASLNEGSLVHQTKRDAASGNSINFQKSLIEGYIHQIIDIKQKERLPLEEMEEKIFNCNMSQASNKLAFQKRLSHEVFELTHKCKRHHLRHNSGSDSNKDCKKGDSKRKSLVAQTQLLPSYIGLKPMIFKQSLIHEPSNSGRMSKDKDKDSAFNANNNSSLLFKASSKRVLLTSKNLNENRLVLNCLNPNKALKSLFHETVTDGSGNIGTSLPFMSNQRSVSNSNDEKLLKSKSQFNTMYLKQLSKQKEGIMRQWREKQYRSLHSECYKVYDSCSDNEEEEIDNTQWVLHPESKANKIRHLLLLLFLSYVVIFSPINVAFVSQFSLVFFIFDTLADFCFFFDFFIPFFIPFPLNDTETYIFDHKLIAVRYLSTWALLDFIALIPFNLVSNLRAYRNQHPHVYIELLKLIKMIKCLKQAIHSDTISKIKVSKSSGGLGSTPIKRLILIPFLFLAFNHICACLWSYLGRLSHPNWIIKQNLQDEGLVDIYFAAMYYNFATIFTIGYGDIYPLSLYERCYNIILQLIGLFLYSFVVSSIMTIVKTMNSSVLLEKKLLILNNIRFKYDMDKRLYNKIFNVLQNDHQLTRKEQFSLINDCPLHIRNGMMMSMYKDTLQFALFKNTNYDFISRVIVNLKEMNCSKGDVLIKEKDYVDELIIVRRGRISIECVYMGRLIKVSQVMRGEHFGEVNMLLNKKCLFDLVVKTKVAQIFLLQKSALIEIVGDSSDVFREKEQKAIINMNLFESKLKKKKRGIDKVLQAEMNASQSKPKKNVVLVNEDNVMHTIPEEGEDNKESITKTNMSKESSPFIERRKNNSNVFCVKKNSLLNKQWTRSSKDCLSHIDSPIIDIRKGSRASNFSSRSLNVNKKKLSSIKRDTILLDKSIKSGSLNMQQPKVFYSSLFLKLNYDNQIAQIEKILKKIKRLFASSLLLPIKPDE